MVDVINEVSPLEEARHRMDGSKVKKLWILSTPTVEGYGVYAEDAWDISDQHRWEVKCPGCSRYQTLNFNQPELDYNNLKLGDRWQDCNWNALTAHGRFLIRNDGR
jgi:phage terminase large subunit GpA-like protein